MNFVQGQPWAEAGAVALELAPLDVPLRVEIAEPSAVEAVAAACRPWQGKAHGVAALRLLIEIGPALADIGSTAIQLEGSLMWISGPGVTARADLDEGFARCAVSSDYLDAPEVLRIEVLEPLVLMLLTRRDRTPVHASGFLVDGLAVLLAGRSGAGKSCLARAADLAGLQVLSDDAVFVQLEPRLRVWGWPTAAHLLAEDAPAPAGPTRLRKGREKQIVPLRSASRAALSCDAAVLCLLAKGEDAALKRIAPAAALERLWPLDEGFDRLPDQVGKALGRLIAGGAWELRLSADPAEALRLLVASLEMLRESASP